MKLDLLDYFILTIFICIACIMSACAPRSVVVDVPDTEVSLANPKPQAPLLIKSEVRALPLADVFFESKATMPENHLGTLEDNALIMKQVPVHLVLVFGHTDSTGRSDSNLALGLERATAVAEFYASMGVPPDRLITITVGEEALECSEDAEQCHKRNRRARTLLITEVVNTP